MPIALELRAITKRYLAGAGSCSIRADVLRGIDLTVHAGESIAVVGATAAGKSTLLLCAAGLLRPDTGVVRWFDDASASAALRSTFYFAGSRSGQTVRRLQSPAPHLHLIDAIDHLDPCQLTRLGRWVSRRCAAGDAVIVTSRDRARGSSVAGRVISMRAGRLEVEPRVPARVAEPAG